jgi:hypothetical protein
MATENDYDRDRFDEEVREQAATDARQQLNGPCGERVAALAQEGRAVQVVGRVVEGKLEIDQTALEEFARRFPDANATFVAVNAPFDPTSSSALLDA